MTPQDANDIARALQDEHGGPVELQIDGKSVMFMSTDVYLEMFGIGSEAELQESIAAVKEGLADMRAGRTRPLGEFMEELHGTP